MIGPFVMEARGNSCASAAPLLPPWRLPRWRSCRTDSIGLLWTGAMRVGVRLLRPCSATAAVAAAAFSLDRNRSLPDARSTAYNGSINEMVGGGGRVIGRDMVPRRHRDGLFRLRRYFFFALDGLESAKTAWSTTACPCSAARRACATEPACSVKSAQISSAVKIWLWGQELVGWIAAAEARLDEAAGMARLGWAGSYTLNTLVSRPKPEYEVHRDYTYDTCWGIGEGRRAAKEQQAFPRWREGELQERRLEGEGLLRVCLLCGRRGEYSVCVRKFGWVPPRLGEGIVLCVCRRSRA